VPDEQLDEVSFVLERRPAALHLGLGRAQQVRREHGRQVVGAHQVRLSVARYPTQRADRHEPTTPYTVCPQKSEPLNILQQQPQICSDLNKILHTQDDVCYKHYYTVSYKSALTLLKYEFLNNITHKS